MYTDSSLAAKDPTTGKTVPWDLIDGITWIDGSVDSDLPMARLAELFNVNHFIVSQVNPHVVPFLAKEEEMVADQVHGNNVQAAGSAFLRNAAVGAKEEIVYRLQQTADAGIMPIWVTKLRSILNQQYSGDINIFPKIAYADFPRVLSNPTQEYMLGCMLTGQRATWPKLSRVQNHVAIELALEAAIHEAKIRSTFQDTQPISRPKSATELCAQNRSKSLLKLSLSASKTAPTSPVLRKSAPTSPVLSRKRDFQPGSSRGDGDAVWGRRLGFSRLFALGDERCEDDDDDDEEYDDKDDFSPLEPHIDANPTTTTAPPTLSTPAARQPPPPPAFTLSSPHTTPPIAFSTTSSTSTTTHNSNTNTNANANTPTYTPLPTSSSSTPERRAFFLANLAMTPASGGSTALPFPVVAAMPRSPGVGGVEGLEGEDEDRQEGDDDDGALGLGLEF